MAIKHLGEGVFIDDAPVATSREADAYAYAEFPSLERVEYGLFLAEVGGRHARADWIGSVEVGGYGLEPGAVGSDIDLDNAKEALRDGAKYVFEEYPMAEVPSREDFDELLEAAAQGGLDRPGAEWRGPGVYDMRDFILAWSSAEEYEEQALGDEASQAIDSMFQGDEWRDALRGLFEDAGIAKWDVVGERRRPPGLFPR